MRFGGLSGGNGKRPNGLLEGLLRDDDGSAVGSIEVKHHSECEQQKQVEGAGSRSVADSVRRPGGGQLSLDRQ